MAEYNSKWTGEQIDKGIEQALESIDLKKPTFAQADTRENINSGEEIRTIFSKIMKWYSDLKSVAFSGDYGDLDNLPVIPDTPTLSSLNAQEQHLTTVATLKNDEWDDNTITVAVQDVTETNTVIISPSPNNWVEYTNSNVRCVAQGDGTLTFTCKTTPEVDLEVNVVIFM